MTDDIVKRLRDDYEKTVALCVEAADEIERLRADLAIEADIANELRAELAAERERATVLQSRLRYIANYIEGRVRAHIAIADDAGSTVAGKKQKVRASEASEILGMVRKEITYD